MNILFLTNHLNAGGITSYLLTHVRGLRKKGHQVFIASSGGDVQEKFRAEGVNLLTVDIKIKSELHPKVYMALIKLIGFVKSNKIDVVHSNTRITQVIGQCLKIYTGCVYVSTCHGYFKRRLGRRIFPCWGEEVIAISQQVLTHLESDFKVPAERIKLIENGIDVDYFKLRDSYKVEKLRKRFELGNKKIIGIVARLSDIKGQDVLIRAMKYIIEKREDVVCLLVGQGRMEEVFSSLIEELDLDDFVKIIPIVNETRDFLHLFDVTVVPSRQEGLGLSVIEAQASGCPVVASCVGGIPSIVSHEKTGLLVESEDANGFAEAVLKVLDNDELRMSIINAALAQVEEKFAAARMVDQNLAIYERLVKRKILG